MGAAKVKTTEDVSRAEVKPPVEYDVVMFKDEVAMLIDHFLESHSAIFITDFLKDMSQQVEDIATKQAVQLIDKFGRSY